MTSSPTLVDTQPLEDDLASASLQSSPPTNTPWGWLVTINQGFSYSSCTEPVLNAVMGQMVKVGRDPSCTLALDEKMFVGSTDEDLQFGKISRVQFQLSKVGAGVALLDKSMNGTYVNGLKVGKDKQHSLDHGDMISILQLDFQVYLFLSEFRMKQLYPERVATKFLVGRTLGEGSSAVVREGFDRITHKQVAMKFIGKEKWPSKYSEPEDLSREVDILVELEHPCITKVYEVFDENNMFVIVMEYAAGGEVFDEVIKEYEAGKLTEAVAKLRFYQICHTISYLHKKNICHRDLKLENILLMNKRPRSLVKITDFGLSKHFNSVDVLETFVGTPVYMAPEVISLSSKNIFNNREYSCKSDCWSLGVVLYMLLSGHQPFRDTNSEMLQEKIMSGKYEPMTGGKWLKVTGDAKDLISQLLVVEPEKRLGADDILLHKWFGMDLEVVKQAMEIMGLVGSEADSGRGSMAVGEHGDGSKRKREGLEVEDERPRRGKKRGLTEEVKYSREDKLEDNVY